MKGKRGDLANYDQLENLTEYYYATLVSKAPGIAADGYTLDMCKTDFSLTIPILFFGICTAFVPVLNAVPLDHFLFDLCVVTFPRYGAAMKAMGSLESLQAI